jgi:putative thiamine transport system permease protein
VLRTAAALGAGPWRRLWRVKLPLLLAPLHGGGDRRGGIGRAIPADAVHGRGRIATLTTEAVTLSSSSDRRVTAVYASLQAVLPFAAYALAFALPALAPPQPARPAPRRCRHDPAT